MPRTGTAIVTGAMRAGYATRGIVYGTVGVLAVYAATGGGRAEGLLGSIRQLGDRPWSTPLLVPIAAGLVGYAIWRGTDAVLDLAGHGRGFGLVERVGLIFVSILHLAFAAYACILAFGGSGLADQTGGSVGGMLAGAIRHGLGRWLVVVIGIGIVSFGFFSIWKGASSRYLRHMRRTETLERLVPLLAFGLFARGVVMAIMGGFIVWAAWTIDPKAAGGYGETLRRIGGAWHGRTLLGIVGFGMVAFSLYSFVESAYRVIPGRVEDAVDELRHRAG